MHYCLGILFRRKNQCKFAIEEFEKALKLKHCHATILCLASCNYRIGNLIEAEDYLERIIFEAFRENSTKILHELVNDSTVLNEDLNLLFNYQWPWVLEKARRNFRMMFLTFKNSWQMTVFFLKNVKYQ